MDLLIKDQLFIVTGASSGLGNAVVSALASEGANVIAVARRSEILKDIELTFPGQISVISGDVTQSKTLDRIVNATDDRRLDGVFVNAGGPPAKSIAETTLEDWDAAYQLLVRWKVAMIKSLLPKFIKQHYGRILFSESSAVKQPVENLVLSNALRLAITGFSKTLSEEYASKGITSNVIGPGHHDTEAVKRLFRKKSEQLNISFDEAKSQAISRIPAGRMGAPDDFASLALWLLSPLSGFVTGQVYCLDGGAIKSTL
jgi:3-oxoacyl-[acyl-carrier protein] reductase